MNDSNPKHCNSSPSAPQNSQALIESVLALQPRLAVFDCDGTLWSGDGGQDFFYWEIARKLIAEDVIAWAVPRYADYHEGRVEEAQMCGEMVTIHRGLPVEIIERAAEQFFVEVLEPRIFLEMQEVTAKLANGCELWAVSSTNEWVIGAGARRFGIPPERQLAAAVHIKDGVATDRLRQVPTGKDKVRVIREQIGREPDVVFGNSMHDAAMLAIARHAFVINPNSDLEELAKQKQWTVYRPHPALAVAENLVRR
jgi:phosphoserine phosphatase